MWRTSVDDKNKSDNILKEALLRQLSHTVKEVQLFYSQTGETCSTQEGPSSLVTVLEAVFLHALKKSILETAMQTVSVTEDAKPTPSFFEAVKSVTHQDTLFWILKLKRINTKVGRSRAWVRLAVNEGAISSYLTAIQSNKTLSKYYRPTAFLRDREALDTANRLLEGLIAVQFDLPINSSLLNVWSSEPLLMSGLWAPALRPTVQMAVDVASGIEVDDIFNIPTASSSVRSLMILDEAQALQIILGSSLPEEEHVPEHLAAEVDKKMDELEVERKEILERSYSYIMESCSPQNQHGFPEGNEEGEESLEKEEPVIEPESQDAPLDEKYLQSYSEIFPADSRNPPDEDRSDRPKVTDQEDKLATDKRPPIEDIILRIPRELGLRAQRFECADCYFSMSLSFGPSILCNVTGEQLCGNCHDLATSVVPSRIMFNWDHTKYLIGNRAAKYLGKIYTQPIFDIEAINPAIYNVVAELRQILRMRKQLNLLHLYLSTCKENAQLPTEPYIYDSVHLFSLADLIAVPGNGLQLELRKLINFGKAHVIGCWFCKEKGFICEFCRDPEVIYPFDEGTIYRCSKCKAVYHEKCLIDKGKSCPKCKRRKERE